MPPVHGVNGPSRVPIWRTRLLEGSGVSAFVTVNGLTSIRCAGAPRHGSRRGR